MVDPTLRGSPLNCFKEVAKLQKISDISKYFNNFNISLRNPKWIVFKETHKGEYRGEHWESFLLGFFYSP